MKGVRDHGNDFVVCHLGDRECALPASDVSEFVALPALTRPPGLPPMLAGFLNLGGTAIPVIRLDHLFDLPEKRPDAYTPVIVLKTKAPGTALLVDRISGIVTAAPDSMLAVQESQTFNNCAVGEIIVDGKAVSVLSVERLLLEKEQQSIAEFQAMEQKRLAEIERAQA